MRNTPPPAFRFAPLAALALALGAGPAHAQVLLHTLASPNEETFGALGDAVAGVGDLDGDAVPDLLVGASGESPGASPDGAGRAYALSGATGAVLHTLASPNEQADPGRFGSAVARVPDGDGTTDLLVGAPFEGLGRAYLFSGTTGQLLRALGTASEGAESGRAVAGVSDVDGDGRGDLLVGAPLEGPDGLEAEGRAHLYSGRTGALLRTLESPEDFGGGSRFGYAVSGTGDLDGDGRGDLLVGARGEFFEGRAYAFSGASGAVIHALASPDPASSYQFGWAVAGVADADGDGVTDLLVGEPNGERAHLFSGAAGGLIRSLASPAVGQDESEFGWAVAGTGDLDGDGTGDVVVGAPREGYGAFERGAGRAYAFSGATGALLLALGSPSLDPGEFGWSVAGVGDVDGDGVGDLLAGALGESPGASPVNAGRAYAFSGASPPALTVAAAALNSPVAQGGRLRLLVTLESNADRPLTGSLRLDVVGPGGVAASRVLLAAGTLPAGQTATPLFRVAVPAGAPVGAYTGVVVAESLSGVSVTSPPFPFEITPGALAAREDAGASEGWAAELIEAGGLLLSGATEVAGAPSSAPVVVPNPAAGRAAVALTLAAPSEVRLSLYDVLGREVASADAGTLAAGAHRIGLDVSALPAGVYVWRLAAGTRMETGRLTVAR